MAEPRLMHGDETMSPVDLPPEAGAPRRHPLRWTTIAIGVASVLLALMNAGTIHGWAVELPPNAITARLVGLTEDWEALTDRAGLGAPRATVHGWWTAAQKARFGGERPEG